MILVPPFTLPNGLSFSGGRVSEDIEYLNTGKRAYELSVGSMAHADQAALYQLGLVVKMGVDVKVPQEAKDAALRHYNTVNSDSHKGHGNWNSDAIDYEMKAAVLPGTLLGEGYEVVAWIKRPRWVLRGGIHVPEAGSDSDVIYVAMPPNGYGIPTNDGLRDPRTGWHFATTPDRSKAVDLLGKSFAQHMDDQAAVRKLAENEVSYSYRRPTGSGKGVVSRGFPLNDLGPFYELARWYGDRRARDLGAFPFRSLESKKK